MNIRYCNKSFCLLACVSVFVGTGLHDALPQLASSPHVEAAAYERVVVRLFADHGVAIVASGPDLTWGVSLCEDLTSAVLDDGVHELDQVGRLVGLLVHFGEVLDGVIDEVLLLAGVLVAEVEVFEIFLDVFFALVFNVRLVEQPQGLDHDLETFVEALVSDVLELPGEGLKDFDGGVAGILVSERDENVVLQALEDADQFGAMGSCIVVLTGGGFDSTSSFEHFEMRPLQILHIADQYDFLQRLDNLCLVPVLIGAERQVLSSA